MDPRDSNQQGLEDQIRVRAKREVRKRMRGVRAALPASAIAERSAQIESRVLALPDWQAAGTVALFSSLPDEVQTAGLVAAARAAGKRVALPVVTDEPVLEFHAPYDGGIARALVTSPYGIAEPGKDAPWVDPATIDLVLVPALAADPRGHRIGYGGGYYDHTLPRCTRAVRVAVLFDFQLIAEVPERTGDVPAQWIITDRRVLRAGEAQALAGG
jgi:5-formyltetrahydrofolate cyclo-ligase